VSRVKLRCCDQIAGSDVDRERVGVVAGSVFDQDCSDGAAALIEPALELCGIPSPNREIGRRGAGGNDVRDVEAEIGNGQTRNRSGGAGLKNVEGDRVADPGNTRDDDIGDVNLRINCLCARSYTCVNARRPKASIAEIKFPCMSYADLVLISSTGEKPPPGNLSRVRATASTVCPRALSTMLDGVSQW
jgi:hypothetical protein